MALNPFAMLNDNAVSSNFPVMPVILNRWSGFAFTDAELSEAELNTLLEAARWTASSYNEQPWQYIVGKRGDETFEKLGQCLLEGNSWAKDAAVLMCSVAKTFFEHKHKANAHHMHDMGAASASMHLQATDMRLYMHQMAGFDADNVRELFGVAEDFTPAAMIAIGHPGDHSTMDQALQDRASAPRTRKDMADMLWKA